MLSQCSPLMCAYIQRVDVSHSLLYMIALEVEEGGMDA